MPFVLDCDIASTLAKIDRMELLEQLFPDSSLFITGAVRSELLRSERAGFSYPEKVFDATSLTGLTDDALESFEEFSSNEGIHYGEAEGIALCKARDWIFLTNDSLALDFCQRNGVKALNLKDLLVHAAKEEALDREEMEQVIAEIEEKDNTTIKYGNEILDLYG